MASGKQGQVTQRGRWSPGAIVTLTKVDGEHTLRPAGGEQIETKTVEEKDGVSFVQFTKGVEVGARYIIHGINDGFPLELRARGREANDDSEILTQAPIGPDRVRLSDGTWSDETPTKESAPKLATTFPGQRQVAKGTQQRSDTPRGSAHPVDPDREEPVRRQESVPDGTQQMSDTKPRELKDGTKVGGGGEASEIIIGAQRQEDLPKGVQQRSDTPTGVAQPFPAGDMVQAQEARDSSQARESRGDNTRASAEPLDSKGVKDGAPTGSTQKASEKRQEEVMARRAQAPAEVPLDQPADERANTSGLDAQGQPLADDAARAAGVKPAEKPSDGGPSTTQTREGQPAAKDNRATANPRSGADPARVKAGKKAARTRKRNEQKTDTDAGPSRTQTGTAATTSNATAKDSTAKK